jgi:hypothetical protein
MGKRGPEPQFDNVACPNNSCKFYGLKGKGIIVGNGTSISRGETFIKYIGGHCKKVFNDLQALSTIISEKCFIQK